MSTPFVVPQIKPHDWTPPASVTRQPLDARLQAGPAGQTLVQVGWAFRAGPMTAFVGPRWLEIQGKGMAELQAEAKANLAAQTIEVPVMDLAEAGEKPRLLAEFCQSRSSDPFGIAAADHLLNQTAMRHLHERLGSKMMVVAIPHEGLLYAADMAMAQSGEFFRFARTPAPADGQPLTTMVFVLLDGAVVGKVRYG